MDSLNSKPTSHNVVESFDEEDPKVTAEKTEQQKEEDELNKLFDDSVAMYKTAMKETLEKIRKGDAKDEQ